MSDGVCKHCGKPTGPPIPFGDETIFRPYCNECAEHAQSQRRREAFDGHMSLSDMPREMWSYDRAIGNCELLDWCVAHADGWLWIGGATRVGKTRALARAAVLDTWKRAEWPSIMWAESAMMFLELAEHSYQGRAKAMELLDRARHTGLLIVDDIGQEKLTDDTRAMLFSLVDYRHAKHKRTWFSSNANGEELLAHIGPGRWPQIRHRIAERGYLRTWDGAKWTEQTERRSEQQTHWWQDI